MSKVIQIIINKIHKNAIQIINQLKKNNNNNNNNNNSKLILRCKNNFQRTNKMRNKSQH